jgi:hypothetical protein
MQMNDDLQISRGDGDAAAITLVSRSLKQSAGLLFRALGTFVFLHVLFDIVLGLPLATICYFVASDGSWVKGLSAALLGFIAAVALGIFLGAQLSAYFTIRRGLRQLRLGSLVFDQLFSVLMGVSETEPAGRPELVRKLHGVTPKEAELALQEAAQSVLGRTDDTGIRGFGKWVARRVLRLLVWAVVKLVMRQAISGTGDEARVDLIILRDRLSDHVDELIADQLRKRYATISVGLTVAVVLLTLLVAYGIRQVPI